MATLFTKIIDGEIPGRFVWEDELCVAFLTIAPISAGHTLVVPRQEVDHWLDAEPALLAHLSAVSQTIGRAIDKAFSPSRVAVIVAGFEVPHLHVHVLGASSEHELTFANADPNADPARLDADRDALVSALEALGHADRTPA